MNYYYKYLKYKQKYFLLNNNQLNIKIGAGPSNSNIDYRTLNKSEIEQLYSNRFYFYYLYYNSKDDNSGENDIRAIIGYIVNHFVSANYRDIIKKKLIENIINK